MANFSLRRYDTQARVSMIVSLASCISLLGMILVLLRRFDFTEFTILYGPPTRYAVLGSGALTILLAAIGFGMGLNSVGQRRNEKPLFSWIGFFVGAGVLCVALALFFLFQVRGEAAV